MLNKVVVAPIGHQGAGKDFLTKAVIRHCGSDRVSVISTGGMFRGVAKHLGMPQDRPTCNRIVKALVGEFGGDFLAVAIEQAILQDPKEVIVYDCPRRLEDMDMLDRLALSCKVLSVFLERSAEDRFAALRERGREGEAGMTHDVFQINEGLEQEKNIEKLRLRVGSTIKCSGTNGQLDAQKMTWCQEKLPSYAAVNWDEWSPLN
ncbi:MAG: hypothetical protein Q7S10_03890 [bacterium]|nr:hypothetical protein [bacterium]